MKKAIIIGATSGIGLELGKTLLSSGWAVGLTGRRVALLDGLKRAYPDQAFVAAVDVTVPNMIEEAMQFLITEMGGCDLVVISAGVGHINQALDLAPELATIDTNVTGFTRSAVCAMNHFVAQGHGHLVMISSIAANRGDSGAPAYGATKAYQALYAQALRKKAVKLGLDITVTDVQPGFVDTAMAQGDTFWLQTVEKAASQIETAIRKKRSKVYITKR